MVAADMVDRILVPFLAPRKVPRITDVWDVLTSV